MLRRSAIPVSSSLRRAAFTTISGAPSLSPLSSLSSSIRASASSLSFLSSSPHRRSLATLPEPLQTIGTHVFHPQQHLDNDLFKAYKESLNSGKPLSKEQRNKIADVLKKWATARGAVNFSHWFNPMRQGQAEKHDAFIDLNFSTGDIKVDFGGSKLFQGETDGSSFPNGGLRVTHRAAAYMSWDLTSPPFVRHDTLYIPAAFVSFQGEPLDNKTPLLRSQDAVSREGVRLLRLLGDKESKSVICNVGWEQEFFVVDRDTYLRRPDLINTGRTLLGSLPPKHQQLESFYFTRPPLRVRSFLKQAQTELWQLGISLCVSHTEVAPAQQEVSPIFTVTSKAADQNQIVIDTLSEVANRHGLISLFHEKPFMGINGSGKHNNWGLNTDTGANLFVPGSNSQEQQRFMAFTAALARALDVHGDVVRVGVATAGNDHRLGAQEAPPAIISLYTGEGMEKHIQSVIKGGSLDGYGRDTRGLDFGTNAVQSIQAAKEDRNRTAPFPFCGNRYEFRAVGANQNIALPLYLLNTAMADSIAHISSVIEKGKSVRDAVAETFKNHFHIIFNGNGYDPAWQVEAKKRGIRNLRTTPDAIDAFNSEKNVELFTKHKVISAEGVHARAEIMYEQYIKTVLLESQTLLNMLRTGILPALAQDNTLVVNSQNSKVQGYFADKAKLYDSVVEETSNLQSVVEAFPGNDDVAKQARYCLDQVLPQMAKVRSVTDKSERLCSRDLWPFPTYEDLLYSHHNDTD